jgi:hypothetical protein
MRTAVLALLSILGCCCPAACSAQQNPAPSFVKWTHGPRADPEYFPIAVWLQQPVKAKKYKAAGINLYVGLWEGPTEAQLKELSDAGMEVICAQNDTGLKHKDSKTIVGWMHGDEPDNAQSLGANKGYGPPVPPEKIVADYKRIQQNDPTRPVLLNLGQGVAWDNWHGRGVRTNHPEDYKEYVKGGDIVSFDIYPVAHDHKDVHEKLWLVPYGVDRLRKWAAPSTFIWNCIECTKIGEKDRKATPHQVKAEVWMSLIAGSRGIIYFVHEFHPFNDDALLDDPEMLKAVSAINAQIHDLAPVLNSSTIADGVTASTTNANAPVSCMLKDYKGAKYLFVAGMSNEATNATLKISGITAGRAEVLGENRTINVADGQFLDQFKPYEVHLYRISR